MINWIGRWLIIGCIVLSVILVLGEPMAWALANRVGVGIVVMMMSS